MYIHNMTNRSLTELGIFCNMLGLKDFLFLVATMLATLLLHLMSNKIFFIVIVSLSLLMKVRKTEHQHTP